MFGQGSYGSELRQGPPAPHQPPPYQQAPSLPAAPMYQQGPVFAHRPFFHQGSVPPPPPPFQTSPSIAQPPFRQSLPIPPPPPRLPPPPPPPALGVQPGQPQQIPLPYQPQTVPQPSAGNSARPYLPTPPPPPPLPPSTHGNSTLVSVNLPQAPGGPPNPLLANQNMIQNPSYQHPSHGVRPMSLQPTPGFQHFPMPPQPTLSASFTSFVQGTASDCQPPCSPPPPPPPLPSSPPPLPSSPPPDEELLEADTFVGSMSEAGNVDAALPTAGDTFCGEAGHSSEVLATSLQEETSTLLTPIEDIIQNERPPILNEQHLQSNTDRSEKQDDSDMDMEDDDFSEPDIEHKSSEFDNRIQESDIRDKRLKESDDLPASSKEMSQYQHNQLLTTIGANELDIEVKASESKTSTVINPMEIHSVVKENKSEFVGRLLFKNGSPLRQIQDYASDDDTEDDENSTTDARTTVEEAAVTPVLNDDASQVHWSGAQADIDSKIDLHAENATTTETLLVSAETIASDTHPVKSFNKNSTITVDNNSLRDVAEMNHRKDDNVSDTEARTVDATTTLPEHDNLENAVEASPQVATSLSEDKKLESVVHKVDEFGRMIRADASESDSESEDMRYNERYAKRGNTRPSVEVRGRRSRSPWHRRDKRSRSPSWSPRAERSRSRSPASSRRAGELARHGRAHPPQCFNFLRGRCRYGSSCHYSHSDVIQDRTKLHHRWGHSGISVKQETQKVMEKSSEETGTGQGHSSSPDMHMHDLQVSKDNSVDEKQIVHNTDGDDIGGLPHLVAPSPGSMEVDNSTFHEIVAAEAQEEQGKQHSVEESGQKSVEQQPSPLGGSPDQVTLSAREDLSNHLDDHIILQHSEGTSAPERLLPLPDEKSDAPTFPQIGPVYSNRSETTESLPLNFPGNAITPIPSDPSGTSGQQFEPQINFLPSVAAPPAPMLPSSASMSSFPPPHNPSLPNEFHFADAAPRPSWTELQPTIPTTGTHPFQFAPNAVPPRNEFHVPSNIRPMPLGLDGVPTVQNYELNQSSHLSVPAHQFLHRPAGTYHVGPIDARHRENHAPFQQNAPGLPSFSNVNMMQGQHNFPPANNFQRNSLIFPNESGTSRFSGGDFHPLSNSGSHPQQLMHGLHAPAGSVPSIHGPPRPLEPPFSSQSAGFSEHKQELLHGVVMPKIASTTYYNPFASTFDQTYREPRYSASFIPNRDSFNDRGQWAASSSGSRSGMFFSSLPGTTASASYEGISLHGHSQGQSTAPTSAALRHSSDVIYGKQYDPLSDSFDSLGTVLRKLDASQEKSGPVGTSVDLDNNILKKSGELIENNQRKVVAKPVSNLDDEVGETATDTEAGAVENGSPLLDEGKDWNPEIPVATTAEDVEIDQQPSPGKTKKGKDSRSMKLFKIAIANFVKEILKPSWRQGNMSKEAFKTIVKKTVDKVAGVMPNHQVPKSQAKIEQYVESSQRKLTKLVMGYVEKYVKT